MSTLQRLVGGVDFGEGPRWHDGRLWYSDFYQETVYAVGLDGAREAMVTGMADRPSGLGWMPDGSMLMVAMTGRKVLRVVDGEISVHAELGDHASWHCNDMVVDAAGNAYVGHFGFDLEGGADPQPASLILVRADGTVETAAENLLFPNGSVITPDATTLIVGQSFGACYDAFEINADATLGERTRWADVDGTAPDGCALDEAGGIWFSDALGSQVVRVEQGGVITHTLPTPQPTYACALGGDDGKTLFVLCSPGSHPDEVAGKGEGGIYTAQVPFAHAGRP